MASSVLLLLFHSSSSIFRFIQTQTHQLWQMLPPWCKISFFYRYLFFFFMTVVGFFFWSCLGPENIYYVWDFKNSCCHWVQLLCLQVSVGACWPRKPLRKKKKFQVPFFFFMFLFFLIDVQWWLKVFFFFFVSLYWSVSWTTRSNVFFSSSSVGRTHRKSLHVVFWPWIFIVMCVCVCDDARRWMNKALNK